ncbi:MAG: ribonuclease HII [Deltaproteobacteria bacterium]|nr:MAG: ribonuclease HII [Deltaproteobacteria bacterium]
MVSGDANAWQWEQTAAHDGYRCVAGVDEVGRGPLAGPVVSAAVVLPGDFPVPGVTDSKKISPARRDHLYDEIYAHAVTIGIGIVDPIFIDRINILRAALLSMALAVTRLKPAPDYLLIDGPYKIPSDLPQAAVVKGDSKSISIGAASIVAKVTRDRLMAVYDQEYPHYGFAGHKGYPTRAHKDAIRTHGCCPIHRKRFKGVVMTEPRQKTNLA